MAKSKVKKSVKYIFLIIIVAFITFTICKQLEYSHLERQTQNRNQDYLSVISVKGENLADRLEEFVNLQKDIKNSEIKIDLDNSWRIVSGETSSINIYLGGISTIHLRDETPGWDILQYSLFHVDDAIYSMTIKFLENQSYSISSEEKDKLEAIVEVYRIIHQNTDDNTGNVEKILNEIKEPMSVIDNHYLDMIEGVTDNT
ncbi:hypothetical protein VBD025_16020 [Virgibacillus flavescens]|uniref:hypothetical protein n=1 Tax=Virgibacillus flavescens TaxID=1611422 RepID=UPI003D354F04